MKMIKILVKNIDKSKFTIYGVSIMLFSMITFVIRTLVDINGLVDLGAGAENVKIVFTFYYIIIVATGFMFILYSLRFYIRSRIKDYSLFIILGTSRKKVLLLMMLEFSAIYFLSTVLGIIIGIFITKTISAIFIFNNIKAYLEWDILLYNTMYSLKTSFLLFIISYSAGFISAMKKNLSNTMTTSLKREYPYRFMCIFVLAGLNL